MPFFYEVNAMGFNVSQRHPASHPNPQHHRPALDVSGTVPTGLLDARPGIGGILVDTLGILATRASRSRERKNAKFLQFREFKIWAKFDPCRARQRVVFFGSLWSLSTSVKLQGRESL